MVIVWAEGCGVANPEKLPESAAIALDPQVVQGRVCRSARGFFGVLGGVRCVRNRCRGVVWSGVRHCPSPALAVGRRRKPGLTGAPPCPRAGAPLWVARCLGAGRTSRAQRPLHAWRRAGHDQRLCVIDVELRGRRSHRARRWDRGKWRATPPPSALHRPRDSEPPAAAEESTASPPRSGFHPRGGRAGQRTRSRRASHPHLQRFRPGRIVRPRCGDEADRIARQNAIAVTFRTAGRRRMQSSRGEFGPSAAAHRAARRLRPGTAGQGGRPPPLNRASGRAARWRGTAHRRPRRWPGPGRWRPSRDTGWRD